jgi:RNA recognition motif-containing protein
MDIYVGNLSYDVLEIDLRQTFEAFGQVTSTTIVKDRYSGKAKGFGFVEMPNRDEAQLAINNLDGKELMGRKMKVNEAHPRTERERSGENRWRADDGDRQKIFRKK